MPCSGLSIVMMDVVVVDKAVRTQLCRTATLSRAPGTVRGSRLPAASAPRRGNSESSRRLLRLRIRASGSLPGSFLRCGFRCELLVAPLELRDQLVEALVIGG